MAGPHSKMGGGALLPASRGGTEPPRRERTPDFPTGEDSEPTEVCTSDRELLRRGDPGREVKPRNGAECPGDPLHFSRVAQPPGSFRGYAALNSPLLCVT